MTDPPAPRTAGLTADRMIAIMLDVVLTRPVQTSPSAPFTPDELRFRVVVAAELALARRRGQTLAFTPELP